MFISDAWAQSAGGGAGGGIGMFLPMILVVAIFYFLLIRPQQKRAKEHQNLVANLSKGDRIVGAGGLIGKVSKIINEREIEMELSDGTKAAIIRDSVTTILESSASKETAGKAPTKANAKKKAEKEEEDTSKKSLKERFEKATNKK